MSIPLLPGSNCKRYHPKPQTDVTDNIHIQKLSLKFVVTENMSGTGKRTDGQTDSWTDRLYQNISLPNFVVADIHVSVQRSIIIILYQINVCIIMMFISNKYNCIIGIFISNKHVFYHRDVYIKKTCVYHWDVYIK